MTVRTVEKKWEVKDKITALIDLFPALHPVIVGLLEDRGIKTEEAAQIFFNPDYDRDIHSPFLFKNMEAVAQRIFKAIEKDEKITIHGDYDADGVMGSVLLMSALGDLARAMNKNSVQIDFYIPHRENEGYGLHEQTVDLLKERGTNLIITVDCGVASKAAILRAQNYGIETIVVDHHEIPDELPDAKIIHPRLHDETYPFPYLAAVGVAWKVACALYSRARENGLNIPKHQEKWLLDLVAIATVTDIMPLQGENRALVYFGLKVLKKTKRPGIQKLFTIAGIRIEKIDTFTIAFQIGPRINAAGRMDHANLALKLLMSEDEVEVENLARELDNHNSHRQFESNQMYEAARMQLSQRETSKLIWAIGDGWSAGLVGLVAGKLSQEYSRPALVMGRNGDRIIGSGRSVPGFHITEALRSAGNYLEHFGGHPQACGFTILGEKNFLGFIDKIESIVNEELQEFELAPTNFIDAEISFNDLKIDFAEQLTRFAPFGEGNPIPKFLIRNLIVLQKDIIGETGKHLRLFLKNQDGAVQKFIGFGLVGAYGSIELGTNIDIVFEVSINDWNGKKEVQNKILEIRQAN